jgi:hypothetical protein
MRRLIVLLLVLVIAAAALSQWRPGANNLPPTPPLSPTPLPEGFSLIPPFVPAYPCELQNVDIYDEHVCRNERVQESVLAEGESVVFIQHDYHLGTGCWGSINQDNHELRVCDPASGATTTLTDSLVTALLPSPSSAWLVYGTMSLKAADNDMLRPHVYRVRSDGTGAAQLDTQAFPDFAVGAPRDLRWLDDNWVAFSLWDGTEDGWHPFRLRADSSGVYEPLADDNG